MKQWIPLYSYFTDCLIFNQIYIFPQKISLNSLNSLPYFIFSKFWTQLFNLAKIVSHNNASYWKSCNVLCCCCCLPITLSWNYFVILYHINVFQNLNFVHDMNTEQGFVFFLYILNLIPTTFLWSNKFQIYIPGHFEIF